MNELISKFQLEGDVVSTKGIGNGHINQTFLVKTTQESYIFQFVNHHVFPNIDMLMNNFILVTNHLVKKGKKTLVLVPTEDGMYFLRYGEDFFRGYKYIGRSSTYDKLPSLDMVKEAARGFGEFHQALSDLDASQLGEVIPDFHNTKKRYADFLESVNKDAKRRVRFCRDDIDFLKSREADYSLLVDALEKREINLSVTHNDPKINNVAFDNRTHKVACILDLDTVMRGTFLYDFGDALRSLFTGDNEDSIDLSLLKVDFDVYEAYLSGYYSMMKDVINEREKELLPYSILIMAEELAMRFLGDYLAGNVYFNAVYPTHNLVRAKTQIALAKDIILHMDELIAITKRICQ